MSLEKVIEPSNSVDNNLSSESASQVPTETNSAKPTEVATSNYSKLTTAKLAKELGFKTQELNDKLLAAGYLQEQEGELILTDAGLAAGGTSKRGKFGEFCLWDSGMVI